ncbi:MAG TPA: hypothetical protein ENG37_00380 [Firmicutes bacterium]|nr:hypothetical protein [Bacillota bacterium]
MKRYILIAFLFLFFLIPQVKIFSLNSDILIYYFYIEGCSECGRVGPYLEHLALSDKRIKITKFNIAEEKNQELRAKLDEIYKVDKEERGVVPAVFIGKTALVGEEKIKENLLNRIKDYSPEDTQFLLEAASSSISGRERIRRYFETFGPFMVMVAGLIDGINPCAFAVLIFFITFLLTQKKGRREILLTGVSFTLGVFLAYLLSGLGLFRVILKISFIGIISKIIYLISAVLVITLSIFSFIDYIKIKKGKGEEISLQLPKIFKKSAREIIKKQPKSSLIVITAFLVAFPVSLIEFLCTGQTYLPTIVYIIGIPELRVKALLMLVIYNFMFVLPLILIFTGVYLGMSNRDLGRLMRENVGKVKLVTSILFFILGIFLIYLSLKSFGVII